MSRGMFGIPPELRAYIQQVSLREPPLLARLRAETARLRNAGMQISPEQGQLMGLLARLAGAKLYVEIGTFTGYSALSVALALPPDGRAICCDVSAEWTAIAKRYWQEAGLADRIELRLAPALQTLDSLLAEGRAGTVDIAFVDADKTGYAAYVERLHALLRPGGLVMIDNVLWAGAVIDPADNDADTVALRKLNAALHSDQRFDISMLPVGDGLTLLRKR